MTVPQFACRSGVASAYVPTIDGATYVWTAEGATILSGAGTHRVTVQLTGDKQAKLTAVTKDFTKSSICCGGTYRDTVGPGTVPVTIEWSDCAGAHSLSATLTIQ